MATKPAATEPKLPTEYDRLMFQVATGRADRDTLLDWLHLLPAVSDVIDAVRTAVHNPSKNALAEIRSTIAALEAIPAKEVVR